MLNVRFIDLRNLFNDKKGKNKDYANHVFMEYYLYILGLFQKFSMPFEINPADFNHPIVNTTDNNAINNKMIKYDEDYFQNVLSFEHQFDNANDIRCKNCLISLDTKTKLNEMMENVYPAVDPLKSHFMLFNGTNNGDIIYKNIFKYSLSNGEGANQSLLANLSMNYDSFNSFQITLIEEDYEILDFKIGVTIENDQFKGYIHIDLKTRTFNNSLSDDIKQLPTNKLLNSKEDRIDNKRKFPINVNDRIRIKFQKSRTKQDTNELKFYYNLEELVVFEVNNPNVKLKPEFKIEKIGEPSNSKPYKRSFLLTVPKRELVSTKRTDCSQYTNNPVQCFNSTTQLLDNNTNLVIKNSLLPSFRGILILPHQFEEYDSNSKKNDYSITNLTGQVDTKNDISSLWRLYMSCLNYVDLSLVSTRFEQNVSYFQHQNHILHGHMMDIKGQHLKSNWLDNKHFLLNVLISSYLMTKTQNETIIPHYDNLFHKIKDDKLIRENMRSYFEDLFLSLSLCDGISELLSNVIDVKLAMPDDDPFMIIINEILNPPKRDNTPTIAMETQKLFDNQKCVYCSNSEKITKSNLKSNDLYQASALNFGIISEKKDKKEEIRLDFSVLSKYIEIKMFSIIDVDIIEMDDHLFDNNLNLFEVLFENNNIKKLPSSILKLTNLISLKIRNNFISNLTDSKFFTSFTNLNAIELDNVSDGKHEMANSDLLLLPSKLSTLLHYNYKNDDLIYDFTQCQDNIEHLTLRGVDWIKSFDRSIKFYNQGLLLKEFSHLMSDQELKHLYSHFCGTKRSLDQEDILRFNTYIFKKYHRLKQLPIELFKLSNLVTLDISYQAITSLPDQIGDLKKLRLLVVDHCVHLESINPNITKCELIDNISIKECLSLKTPPPEICKHGTKLILSYLKRLLSDPPQFCKRTKLMLVINTLLHLRQLKNIFILFFLKVGLGEAGKTSLLNSLMNKVGAQRPEITDGIDITEWSIDLEDKTKLVYSMWDFGNNNINNE
jgi:hypothetical protein